MRRDVAQPGSAFAWGARGRWFESSRPDRREINRTVGLFFYTLFFNHHLYSPVNPKNTLLVRNKHYQRTFSLIKSLARIDQEANCEFIDMFVLTSLPVNIV